MIEQEDRNKLQSDAQSVYDSTFGKVIELGYPKEVAIAVAMTASTRFIELVED